MILKTEILNWVYVKTPKVIAETIVDKKENVNIRDVATTWTDFALEVVQDDIIEDWIINLCWSKMESINKDLMKILDPTELYVLWRFFDKIIKKIEEECLAAECYEGLHNLKKLKELF